MKIQIRNGVFETNSSSVHSLTLASYDDYNAWMSGEVFLDEGSEEFLTLDETLQRLKESAESYPNLYPEVNYTVNNLKTVLSFNESEIKEHLNHNGFSKKLQSLIEMLDSQRIFSYSMYENHLDSEHDWGLSYFTRIYEDKLTKNGEKMVIFGYTGYDG